MSEKMGIPGAWTPENLKKQEIRAKYDAELIGKGAEYVAKRKNSKNLRLDVTLAEKDKIHAEMEQQLKSRRINRYLEFMQNKMHSQINLDDKEGLAKIESRIKSDDTIIQDAIFKDGEWVVIFKDGTIQNAKHEMDNWFEKKKCNERTKKWDERVEELRREYPETMKCIEQLSGSCIYCTNGSPTNWGNEFNSIVEKETGLDADDIENAIRHSAKEYREAGGFSSDDAYYAESSDYCSSFGDKGVMSILSAVLNARKSGKIKPNN